MFETLHPRSEVSQPPERFSLARVIRAAIDRLSNITVNLNENPKERRSVEVMKGVLDQLSKNGTIKNVRLIESNDDGWSFSFRVIADGKDLNLIYNRNERLITLLNALSEKPRNSEVVKDFFKIIFKRHERKEEDSSIQWHDVSPKNIVDLKSGFSR